MTATILEIPSTDIATQKALLGEIHSRAHGLALIAGRNGAGDGLAKADHIQRQASEWLRALAQMQRREG